MALRSMVSPVAYLAPASVDRTTSDCRPASELTTASGRLNDEIEIGIRPQHPERQRDQSRRRAHRRLGLLRAGAHQCHRRSQRLCHGVGRGIAIVGALFQRAVDDHVNSRSDRRSRERWRMARHDAVVDLHQIVAGEGRAARQHLEEQEPVVNTSLRGSGGDSPHCSGAI